MDQQVAVSARTLGMISCDYCPQLFEKKGAFNRHRKTHTKPHLCDVCNQGFALRTDLHRHRSKHASVDAKLRCPWPDCDFKGTDRRDNFRRHLRRYHQTIGAEYGEAIKSQKAASRSVSFLNAVASRNIALVKMTIECGADILETTSDGKTGIHIAAACGDVDIVQYLFEIGLDGNAPDSNSNTAAHDAALNGHSLVVQCLATNGINAMARDRDGRRPIHRAVYNGHVEVLEILLLEENALDELEPLMVLAASKGYVGLVNVLMQHGARANSIDEDGSSALWKAAANGHTEVVRLLLKHDPNTGQMGTRRTSPLHQACLNSHLEIVRLLVQYEYYAEKETYNIYSELQLAARSGKAQLVGVFLECGIDLKSNSAIPVLLSAANRGHEAIVKLLLREGINVNAEFREVSPLSYVVANQYERIVEILLQAGADPNVRSFWVGGKSVLQVAEDRGNVGIARLLRAAGATEPYDKDGLYEAMTSH